MEFTPWVKFVIIPIGFIILAMIFIFKTKIKKVFDGKLSNEKHLLKWKVIGYLGIFYTISRMMLMFVGGYPLRWEIIPLHVCRLLILLIFIFLAAGKVEWTKYLIFLSVIGFSLGMYFNYEAADQINSMTNGKGYIKDNVYIDFKTGKRENIDILQKIMLEKGLTFYSVGLDNFYWYDVIFAHLTILILPIFIWTAYSFKFNVIEFHRMQVIISMLLAGFWLLNIGANLIPSKSWKSNYWYIGLNENNDHYLALGKLSSWPQNIFTYWMLGVVFTSLIYLCGMMLEGKWIIKDKKIINKYKPRLFKELKEEYSKGYKYMFTQVFNFKLWASENKKKGVKNDKVNVESKNKGIQ